MPKISATRNAIAFINDCCKTAVNAKGATYIGYASDVNADGKVVVYAFGYVSEPSTAKAFLMNDIAIVRAVINPSTVPQRVKPAVSSEPTAADKRKR